MGMGVIASSSRSMLSCAESWSLCTKTVDNSVDEEELENDPEDMIMISTVSSSDA